MKRHGAKPLDKTKKPRLRKHPYTTPELTIHGDAREVTMGLSGLDEDGQGGSTPIGGDDG